MKVKMLLLKAANVYRVPGVVLSMSRTLCRKHLQQGRSYYVHFTDGETEAPSGEVKDPVYTVVWPGLEPWQSDVLSLGMPSWSEGRGPQTSQGEAPLEMPHGVIEFPGGHTHLTLGFEQKGSWPRGAWWPWCQGWSGTIWCFSTPLGAWESLEAPGPRVLKVEPGRDFPAAGPRAAPEKEAMQKGKKKKNEEKRKMCCYF